MHAKSLDILLVDDDSSTNEVLVKMLSRSGHRPVHAADGKQALRLAAAQSFDLVISDIGLPDVTGLELLKQLRVVQPDLRAIAISGYGDTTDYARSREAGYDLHVTKPTQFSKIEAAIAKVYAGDAPG
jgi:CheY-like chemotaxis protein